MFKGVRGIKLLLFVGVLAAASLIFSSSPTPPAGAQSSSELHGWAWSSNIGWVSMNCADGGVCGTSNYRVRVGPGPGPGGLSGYAWSSNIGWIDFAPAGPYPAAGPQYSARIDDPAAPSSPLSGWARALSNGGGWDGWIKMSGTASGGGSYGVSVSGGQFSGFAWGGDVIGWLNFDMVTRIAGGPPPSCPTFTSSPRTVIVTPGGSADATLLWQCENVTSCSIDQGVGAVSQSGSRQVSLDKTTTFTLSCSGGGGATATTFIEVKVFTPSREEVRP